MGPPRGEPGTWIWTPQPLRQTPDREMLCPRCDEPTIEGGEDKDVFVHADRDDYEPGNPLQTAEDTPSSR
jgi:hypothetical protein